MELDALNCTIFKPHARNAFEFAPASGTEDLTQAGYTHLFADLEKTLRESDRSKRVEFYTHEEGWKNKLICGDSLHVMESLLHYEGMLGKVQMIYIDPPYGIKYDSNFQQRVDVSENNAEDESADDILTIKAFRDTWTLGAHSYLSYLQERAYLARELLSPDGSLFLQCSSANVHRIRLALDEVFGSYNLATVISWKKAAPDTAFLKNAVNYLLWYVKDLSAASRKAKKVFRDRQVSDGTTEDPKKLALWADFPDGTSRTLTTEEKRDPTLLPEGSRVFRVDKLTNKASSGNREPVMFEGKRFVPPPGYAFKTHPDGMNRLIDARRVIETDSGLSYKFYLDDNPLVEITNLWEDTAGKTVDMVYVVQTNAKIVRRCIAMSTDPGDLVLDPTCGGGTTAAVAENLGRRWVTIDTSRVAINVARKRLMSAAFDHYTMRGNSPASGFRYEVVRKLTMSTIADDMEPQMVDRVDRPLIDTSAVRVCGPFEVMSVGRYSVEDWKGYVVREGGTDAAKLENYIGVICRLYRKDAAIQGANGLVHAVAETEKERIAISVGPLSGRVTAKQINDAVQDALASGTLETHVLGWAFEANVGEMKSQLEKRGRVKVELIMIRPDTLSEGLKITKPEMLFSPLALPDVEVATVETKSERQMTATLKGVAVFDRRTRGTEYRAADSGYVAAWYLDEDYDGDCFVDCQMFFDFKKSPNLRATLRVDIDPQEFELQTTSHPFPIRGYKRIAVKVVDVFGNESTVVKDLG